MEVAVVASTVCFGTRPGGQTSAMDYFIIEAVQTLRHSSAVAEARAKKSREQDDRGTTHFAPAATTTTG